MASTINALNLQPTVLPSFGGSQTEPNVTYVNSEGPILPLEQSLNPSAMIELDSNNTTRLENYSFAAYTLEEISQPTNNTSIDLLYNVEPDNLPRDINGAIVIDQNTNTYQGKVLTVNLSANRYFSEEFDRIVDVEFTQLIPPVNTLNIQDILNENQSLKDLVALLQSQNNELLQSNTQIPDGTLVRSADQLGYYAIIDKGKRRWFGFNEQLVQTVETTTGRSLVDIPGNILIQIPEGSDYREADFAGTGVTVANTHPNNLYILGILNDPFAVVSTNAADIVNRQWRITEFNATPENGTPILGAIDINNTIVEEARRAIAFAADQVITNGSGVIPDTRLTLNFNSNNYQPNSYDPDIIVWTQNSDGSLSLLASEFTYVITANFWTAQIGNENVLSIRFNYDTYSITYRCIEVENSSTTVIAPTQEVAIENIQNAADFSNLSQNSVVQFFDTNWYVRDYNILTLTGTESGSISGNQLFNTTNGIQARLLRFNTGGTGKLAIPGNFTENQISNPNDITWVLLPNNTIKATSNTGSEYTIIEYITTGNELTIELELDAGGFGIPIIYTCTTTP